MASLPLQRAAQHPVIHSNGRQENAPPEAKFDEKSLVSYFHRCAQSIGNFRPFFLLLIADVSIRPPSLLLLRSLFVGGYGPIERQERIKRFMAKRQRRRWGKRVQYLDRHVQAGSQARVRGRFAKKTPPSSPESSPSTQRRASAKA